MPGDERDLHSSLVPAVLVGLALGMLGLSQYLLPEGALGPGLDNPTTFEHLLRALSAALTEEILFRLGLLTFFAWVIGSVARRPVPDAPSQWAGNVLVAPIFAGAHLPHILTFGSVGWNLLNPIVLVSATASIVMGWLYIRYGLISAVVAHSIVDLVVYVIAGLWI
jgi:membrane protease YdiL (CAAX protease family)